jgi:large subunit ribosomal protein L2
MVDFRRDAGDAEGRVLRIEYDPCRSAFIALIESGDRKSYIIAPEEVEVGSIVGGDEIRPGACVKLADIPSGTKVHNIESRPGVGARIVRAAGTFARVLGLSDDAVSVRLPSGQIKKLSKKCTAIVGSVSNSSHMHVCKAKAGRSRWSGVRPTVRGMAMNSRDHKLGGGRGKAKGCQPVSPWGQLAKGLKTRKKSKGRL